MGELEIHGGGQLEALGPLPFVRRSNDRTDFEDLVDLGISREKWSKGVEFGHDAAHCPNVDWGRVHGGPEKYLWRPIPPGGDVIRVWRPRPNLSGQAKVCNLDQIWSHAE